MRRDDLEQTVRTYFAHCDQADLRDELLDLFRKFDVVRDYYQLKLASAADADLGERYRGLIQAVFFPPTDEMEPPRNPRLSDAKKALAEYAKLTANPAGLIDLRLFFVEMGLAFTNRYGDMPAAFYRSLASMYAKALQQIAAHQWQDRFQTRCAAIRNNIGQAGWDVQEAVAELYQTYYP